MAFERQAQSLMDERRYAEVEHLVRARMAAEGGLLHLWRILATAVRAQGRIAEAAEIQARLVEAVPGDLAGRFDLAESLLLLGDFQRGWREYRWRYSLPHTTRIERKVQRPRWDGRRIDGRTLLIHDEQGFGDTLQFVRMVPWAKTRSGAQVVLEIHPQLLPFAERMGCADFVVPRGQLPPAFDFHCEMMSLPWVMGLRIADLPGAMPYLSPLSERVAKWRKRLAKLPRPLVALVWAGSPTHQNDANRSLTLADFAPLAPLGLTFLAVQKGPKAAEAETPPGGLSIVPLDREIADFDDTAAILVVADLLISVDSSPIHLAGALGRPAWVLLPFVPDWRWLLHRDDTPWYPSLRLLRQSAPGDWVGVMERLHGALAKLRS